MSALEPHGVDADQPDRVGDVIDEMADRGECPMVVLLRQSGLEFRTALRWGLRDRPRFQELVKDADGAAAESDGLTWRTRAGRTSYIVGPRSGFKRGR